MRMRVDDVLERLLVERDREQIVGVQPRHAGPAQVIGDPTRPHGVRQLFELFQVVEVERVGAADRQRDAVHDDGVALGDLLQDVARPAARVHEVLGDDLEPIHCRVMSRGCTESGRSADQGRDRDWRCPRRDGVIDSLLESAEQWR